MTGSRACQLVPPCQTATAVGMSHAHRGRAKRSGTVIQQDAAFKHLHGTGRAKEVQKKKRKSMHQLRKGDGADLQDDSDDGIGPIIWKVRVDELYLVFKQEESSVRAQSARAVGAWA